MNELDTVMSILGSTRSVRKYEDRPVPREALETLVRAGTYASNPRNSQPWRFIVADDPELIARLGEFLVPRVAELDAAIAKLTDPAKIKVYSSGAHLLRNFGKSPAIIFVCSVNQFYGKEFDSREAVLSATHAASQNILVAARASGLGAAYTTFHIHAEDKFNEALNVTEGMKIDVTIPVGYPSVKFGPVNRKPIEEVMAFNRLP
jgi:nitroreductase